MSLLDDIRNDLHNFINDTNLFSVPATFVSPEGQTVEVNLIHTRHNLSIDTEGNQFNSVNAHVSVMEKALTDQGYNTRDTNGKVNLAQYKTSRHKVIVSNSYGEKTYSIKECFPSDTFGLLVIILQEWQQ